MVSGKPRVALLADFKEERWPSMDHFAEMLAEHLATDHREAFEIEVVRPRFVGFHGGEHGTAGKQLYNAARLFNRFVVYPRSLARLRGRFDLFHILDHSYSHLIHQLAGERCVVTCHDLDTFRSILRPRDERRSAAFRAMTAWILAGFRKAGLVICVSEATRDAIVRHALIAPDRIRVIHNGVHPVFTDRSDESADAEFKRLRAPSGIGNRYLLHVGGTQRRKRIDLLLAIFAAVRGAFPDLGLIRIGAPLGSEDRRRAAVLGIEGAIGELGFVERRILAAAYRSAAAVLITSEDEGFGLPLVEAMACGAQVIASDIPALREVGGEAVEYRAVGDIDGWSRALIGMLGIAGAARRVAIERAAGFTWEKNAALTARSYRAMLGLDQDHAGHAANEAAPRISQGLTAVD